MSASNLSELDQGQLRLLLVCDHEDSGFLRDLLSRTGEGHLVLDHARSPEEALARLRETNYDLLLCEYTSGDGMALRLLRGLHRNVPDARVIFLSDHVDETAMDAALNAGTGRWVQRANEDEPAMRRTIRYALDVYCKERQR